MVYAVGSGPAVHLDVRVRVPPWVPKGRETILGPVVKRKTRWFQTPVPQGVSVRVRARLLDELLAVGYEENVSQRINHRREGKRYQDNGTRWENPNPMAGCNSTHTARSYTKKKRRHARAARRAERQQQQV